MQVSMWVSSETAMRLKKAAIRDNRNVSRQGEEALKAGLAAMEK